MHEQVVSVSGARARERLLIKLITKQWRVHFRVHACACAESFRDARSARLASTARVAALNELWCAAARVCCVGGRCGAVCAICTRTPQLGGYVHSVR